MMSVKWKEQALEIFMRRYKPDIMTVLVLLVAISFVATTGAHAREIGQAYATGSTSSLLCMSAWKDIKTCMSAITPSYTVHGYSDLASVDYFTDDSLAGGASNVAGMFNMDRIRCTAPVRKQSSQLLLAKKMFGEDFPDLNIAISHNMAIDFGMDSDDNSVAISSVFIGYKACW